MIEEIKNCQGSIGLTPQGISLNLYEFENYIQAAYLEYSCLFILKWGPSH